MRGMKTYYLRYEAQAAAALAHRATSSRSIRRSGACTTRGCRTIRATRSRRAQMREFGSIVSFDLARGRGGGAAVRRTRSSSSRSRRASARSSRW